MVKIRLLFPATTIKVNRKTDSEINTSIQQKSEKNVKGSYRSSKEDINARIRELNYEWDIKEGIDDYV